MFLGWNRRFQCIYLIIKLFSTVGAKKYYSQEGGRERGGGDGEGEVGGGEEGDESDDTISLLTSYPESDKTHPSHKSRGM